MSHHRVGLARLRVRACDRRRPAEVRPPTGLGGADGHSCGSNAPAEAPVAILVSDQQISLQRGKSTSYAHTAIKVQTSQGLAAGNLSIAWDPATNDVTVHKLHIRRGNQVIDVLASGQRFTTIRREANLEAAMLDGRLTANIQPRACRSATSSISQPPSSTATRCSRATSRPCSPTGTELRSRLRGRG